MPARTPGASIRHAFAVLFLCAAAGLAPGWGTAADGPAPTCRDCHKDVAVEGAVHKGLSCVDCHAGLIFKEGTPPHQAARDLPAPGCGPACHPASAAGPAGRGPEAYPDSVHGRAFLGRGLSEVARCWDCHGAHRVRPAADPESSVNRRNVPLTCSRCHEDMAVVLKFNIHAGSPYREYRRSVHGRSAPGREDNGFAAVCTDCHGVHDIRGLGAARLPAREPATCGACHPVAFEEYSRSIHGRQAAQGNVDVPLCVDCHGEHGIAPAGSPESPTAHGRIPDTCSACHARPEIMRKYGVPEDRIATFIDSYHGIAVGLGGTAEATCVDCHGVHDIRPAVEPESKVFPANLAGTCGRPSCHPDMTGRIAGTKIHRDYSRPGSGAPYYVQKALLWAVFALTVLTVLYILASMARRIRGRSRGA